MPLTEEQNLPLKSSFDHQIILAGPGTGKSFTILGYISHLINVKHVDPNCIFLITFTRAATSELKKKVLEELGEGTDLPKVFTLHSFALRQLMRNAEKITALPPGFAIANDFEERYLIMEDIKKILQVAKIKDIKRLFNLLSANWETLNIEKGDWEVSFDNPQFLGAWQEHREIYGYMLRSELVYQLKKSLEQEEDMDLEGPIEYLIVDEYQDLNQCDLAIIEYLRTNGTKLFCAGDDDQSIYGFRYAYPEGIRNFQKEVDKSEGFKLTECFRCDENILLLALQVIGQDPKRISKKLKSMSGLKGECHLLRFPNQNEEAKKIANSIRILVDNKGIPENEILVLLRSDFNNSFSKPIIGELIKAGLTLNNEPDILSSFEQDNGRYFLSILKFLKTPTHDLALRTILELTKGLGKVTFESIYTLARSMKMRFHEVVEKIISGEITNVTNLKRLTTTLKALNDLREGLEAEEDIITALDKLKGFIPDFTPDFESRIKELIESKELRNIEDLIGFADEILSPLTEAPNETATGIRVMSMHQAKGLTAQAVFIVGAEEEYIPGRGEIDEERRLLYVSITRAKHYLFITYCNNRLYAQQHTGFTSEETTKRTLTRYLRDLPIIKPVDGKSFELK
jgi:DNA helicase-2/ATP-dependent DNA helicase PcrA